MWEQKAGVDYCQQYTTHAHIFLQTWREGFGREPWEEACLLSAIDFQQVVSKMLQYAHELERLIPEPCGKCEWCVNEAVKRGECPEGWSDPYICPDCRARRRSK